MSYLAKKAVLADLTVSIWNGTKLDRKVSREVCADKHADISAGRLYKDLVSRNSLAAIKQIAGAARTYHTDATMPWSKDGQRLLPATSFEAYEKKLLTFKYAFEKAVTDFLVSYDHYVDESRVRLGDLFRSIDYPTRHALGNKFSFSFGWDALPDSSDFRVDLADGEAERIRLQIERRQNELSAAAQREPLERMYGYVQNMHRQLSSLSGDIGNGARKTRICASLVGNISELADLLPAFNLSGDPEIAKLATDLKSSLCAESVKDLRDHDALRDSVATEAARMQTKIESMLA